MNEKTKKILEDMKSRAKKSNYREPVKSLTPKSFDELISSDTPTIVDFYTDSCWACKQIHPYLNEFADSDEYKDKVSFGRVNCSLEYNDSISQEYSIQSVPQLKVFRSGEYLGDVENLSAKKDDLKKRIDEALEKYII